MKKRTLHQKVWDRHLICEDHGVNIVFIDRHIIHEVTSPQAFEALRLANRKVFRPDLTLATMDHNVSTRVRDLEHAEPQSRQQMNALSKNCREFNIELLSLTHRDNGIVHMVGPELGFTLPGTVIVCGDSHTATHGAFGALAFGIGTSEVEHVLTTQTLRTNRAKDMNVVVNGTLGLGVSAKDVILAIIGKIGTHGGQGYVIEYSGSTIRDFSMEERMTVCNMSIEGGAKAGMIAPDEKTMRYLCNRDYSPLEGSADWDAAVKDWQQLKTDEEAAFDRVTELAAEEIEPQISWGTNPAQVCSINGCVPMGSMMGSEEERKTFYRSLEYMGLKEGQPMTSINIDRVFIGSCTNSRIEDLRKAATVLRNRKKHPNVHAIVVPGSYRVRRQAEVEGLDRIFIEAGFEWRHPGCSMCLGMNDDILAPQERCASTSNRNFEGRQGRGGRTHLMSPEMAAAAAISGHPLDIREWLS